MRDPAAPEHPWPPWSGRSVRRLQSWLREDDRALPAWRGVGAAAERAGDGRVRRAGGGAAAGPALAAGRLPAGRGPGLLHDLDPAAGRSHRRTHAGRGRSLRTARGVTPGHRLQPVDPRLQLLRFRPERGADLHDAEGLGRACRGHRGRRSGGRAEGDGDDCRGRGDERDAAGDRQPGPFVRLLAGAAGAHRAEPGRTACGPAAAAEAGRGQSAAVGGACRWPAGRYQRAAGHRSRQGRGDGRGVRADQQHAVGGDGLAVRQRLPQQGAAAAGDPAGRCTPPDGAGGRAEAVRAQQRRRHGGVVGAGDAALDRGAAAAAALSRLPGAEPVRRTGLRRVDRPGHGGDGAVGGEAAVRFCPAVDQPVAAGAGVRCAGAVVAAVVDAGGVPGAGGTVRELVDPAGGDAGGAAGPARCGCCGVVAGHAQRRVLQGRHDHRDRAVGEERHPHRRVRAPAAAAGSRPG